MKLNDGDFFAIIMAVFAVVFCLYVKFVAWFFKDDDSDDE